MVDLKCSCVRTIIQHSRQHKNVSTDIHSHYQVQGSIDSIYQAKRKRRELSSKHRRKPPKGKICLTWRLFSSFFFFCFFLFFPSATAYAYHHTWHARNAYSNGLITLATCGVNVLMELRLWVAGNPKRLEIVQTSQSLQTPEVYRQFSSAAAIHTCCTTKTCALHQSKMYSHWLFGKSLLFENFGFLSMYFFLA